MTIFELFWTIVAAILAAKAIGIVLWHVGDLIETYWKITRK